ncbi:cyclopropane mycolic acid synthase family methyltransferase [Rhodococcus jostii]|uniref:Cyclopropane-fatty-acyl-phospholipid synthase n=1 Tax=Rhodococcus jostii TaxID=132919 RepID=A0A1H4QHV1_RHOJO|nr:cyclopropane mycolic acid synthase family methyltransferase [Rhodococcus jostii]SEC19205.1 cyclopropane-fatty-acyl-phospholipid synthase [Rhodococcus jostii]
MSEFKPFVTQVQAHYDLSDDFFRLFLDPSMTYGCAYFQREDMTLEQAQRAKIDLALGKCDLRPGMTLLDIGCGWGSTMLRAIEKYDVNVVGLTLSDNQYRHVSELVSGLSGPRTAEVRRQGWEEFDEPVDRIVSIGAFEHFRRHRYQAFFDRCRDLLPADGRMLLHSIIAYQRGTLEKMSIPITEAYVRFAVFIVREIFRGGQLPEPDWVTAPAERAGFGVDQIQPLQSHYARTLDRWSGALAARHDDAVRIASEEVYQRYMKYLTGCADQFRSGRVDVMQFTLVKQG